MRKRHIFHFTFWFVLCFAVLLGSGTNNSRLDPTNVTSFDRSIYPTTNIKTAAPSSVSNLLVHEEASTNIDPKQGIPVSDIAASMRRALFSEHKLNFMRIDYGKNEYLYFYQWKNYFAHYITELSMSYEDYLGLKFNIQEFLRVMTIEYSQAELQNNYVATFLMLSLSSALLDLRHVILDKYAMNPILLEKLIKEIKAVHKICNEMDRKKNDWHNKYNDYVLKMLLKVVQYYEAHGNVFYPDFRVWETSIEEITNSYQNSIDWSHRNDPVTNTNR